MAEDASQGIGPSSVVHHLSALRQRVAYITATYRQQALAEEFVRGREFNVSLWGDPPQMLPLAEIDFRDFADPYERIVSFAAKWEADSFEFHHTPVLCPAPVSPAAGAQLAEIAWHAWQAVGCRGYARVDIRLSDEGIPHVVDINCNPDISPDAGFFKAVQTAGFTYEEMANAILSLALRQTDEYEYHRTSNRVRWFGDHATNRLREHLLAGGDQLCL